MESILYRLKQKTNVEFTMKQFLYFVIAISIIYNVIDNKMPNFSTPPSAHNDTTTEKKNDDENKDESIGTKILSTVVTSALKTEQGQEVLGKMIQPQQTFQSETPLIVQQYDVLTQLFKMKTYGEPNSVGPVSCGHSVYAQYKIYGATDGIIEEEGTKTFLAGTGSLMFGLENAIIGMYKGQTREATIPGELATNGRSSTKFPKKTYKIEVTILDILPKTFINPSEVRVFDNVIAAGSPYLCGTIATFDMKISKLNGEVIYDSVAKKERVSMRVGDNSYPFIMSYALFQKIPEGKRTLITSGKYLRAIGNKDQNEILGNKMPQDDEFFLIDLFDFKKPQR